MRAPRLTVAILCLTGAFLVATPGGASALLATGTDPCDVFEPLYSDAVELSNVEFDGDNYAKLGAAYKKASAKAPKQLKSTVKKVAKVYLAIGKAGSAAEAESQVSERSVKALQAFTAYVAANCSASGASGASGSTSGGSAKGGTLTLGGETIALDSARCYLKEQTAAGQKIELNGQGYGTNAAGDDIVLDFTRYAASSDFAGDDISISIGDPRSPDSVQQHTRLALGAVTRSGSTFTSPSFELRGDDGVSTSTSSFELKC